MEPSEASSAQHLLAEGLIALDGAEGDHVRSLLVGQELGTEGDI